MSRPKSEYYGSFVDIQKCPEGEMPEYSFIGRSNVGKSSLINAILDRKELARVSKTPGKTQTINFFLIDESWFLVDLPGYGYAKISQRKREDWIKMIRKYLLHRKQLTATFVLLDLSISPQKNDLDFINWLGENGIPLILIFTKSDKTKKTERRRHLNRYKNKLLESWNELPPYFITSASKRTGISEVFKYIIELNEKVTSASK